VYKTKRRKLTEASLKMNSGWLDSWNTISDPLPQQQQTKKKFTTINQEDQKKNSIKDQLEKNVKVKNRRSKRLNKK